MIDFIKKQRANLPIRIRLRILAFVQVFLIIILCLYSIRSIHDINSQIKTEQETYISNIINLSIFSEKLYSLIVENHITIEKNNALNKSRRLKTLNTEQLQSYINEYEENITTKQETEIFSQFITEIQNYIAINKEIYILLKNNQDSLATQVKATREIASFRKVQDLLHQILLYNISSIEDKREQLALVQKNKISFVAITSSIILIVLLLVSYFFVVDLKNSINSLKNNLSILKSGEIPKNVLPETKTEIGEMAYFSNKLVSNLNQVREFAKEIGKGNYNYVFKPLGENDVLSNSLLDLRDNLVITKKEEDKRKIEDEQRNWSTKGLAMFGDILRQKSGNINELADEMIKNLVYYLKANQGGVFLYNDTNKEDVYIELLSAFAYDRKKFLTKKIRLGEGLIGMCAIEKNTIYMTEIPDDYMDIESGLGDAKPRSILITPLKTETGILGIIEIASFKTMAPYEIEFVEKLTESITSSLSTVRINTRTAELLSESQKKSEELAIREEEMRLNMEEMRISQEETNRSKAEMTSILAAIDQTLLKSEYEIDGKLISANLRYLSTFGYHLDEIQGKFVHSFIPIEYIQEFNNLWKTLLQGSPEKITLHQKNRNGRNIWLLSQYTPVLDESGKVIKILHLANDITEQKLIEEETKNQANILLAQEKELKDNFVALKDSQEEIARKNIEIQEKVYFYEQVLDAVSFPIYVTDLDDKWTFINKAVEEIIGKKREEVYDIPANKELILNQPDKIFKFDTFYTYDTKYNKTGHIDLFQDITEQRKIEEHNKNLLKESLDKAKQLSAQEEEMRQNLEELLTTQEQMEKKEIEMTGLLSAIDNIVMKAEYSIDGKLISANHLFISKLEYYIDEILGKSIFDFAPEDAKEDLRKIWSIVLNGDAYQGIVKRKGKQGREIWLLLSYTPVKDNDGKVIKIVSVANDITREKEIEENAKQKIENIIENEKNIRKDYEKLIEEQKDTIKKIEEKKNKEINKTSLYETEIDKLYNSWLNSLY